MKPRIALPIVLLLILPICGYGQSQLNFPRLFAPADLGSTGFAIVNPSSAAASVNFTLFSGAGAIVGSVTRSIDGKGQFSQLGSELFPSASTGGWVRASSTTTGLQGFWLGGDFANFMDGAEAAPPARELVFPLATATTELDIANVATANGSATSNTVTISIYGTAGTEVASALTQNLAPNGVFKGTLASMFPSVNFSNVVYVRAAGTGAMAATTVVTDFIHSPSWSVVNGVDPLAGPTEANFPHVPSGPENGSPKWTGVLGITNFSPAAQTLTITYNRSSGAPVVVTRNLAGRGVLRETVKDLFSFGVPDEDGWVRVSGTGPLGGFIAYGYNATSGVAVVPVQNVPRTTMIFSHVANGPIWGTGLALLNTTAADATVEVYIMRRTGVLVGGAQDVLTASFTLPGGTKRARLLTELVPTSNADDGFVFVRSANNIPLYGLQLFFSRDLKVVANVAAGVVDPSITFAPPTPTAPLPAVGISTLTPSPTTRGSSVTITGSGFSTTPASNTVVFAAATGSVTATPTAATATSLTVTVPATAVSGPVYVATGNRFTNSVILSITANSSSLVTSTITVGASQNTLADIYVPPPAGPSLNGTALALTDVTGTTANVGAASVEGATGATRRLWIVGDGVSSATTVSVSGAGVSVLSSGVTINGGVVVHISIAANAATGPRNIVLTNANLDTSIITGGLIVR